MADPVIRPMEGEERPRCDEPTNIASHHVDTNS